MKIAVLTSSRADYSIYLPLLKKIQKDPKFDLFIIAFGTHLSKYHGHTIDNILGDGFEIEHRVESILIGDNPETISTSIAITIQKFASLWPSCNYDLIFALGDRFEMYAAVLSTLPFNFKIAHLHGGETTLGAIDNKLRHSITLMSSLHFTSTDQYKERVVELLGFDENVFNVGALSIENMLNLNLYNLQEFNDRFGIDMSKSTLLCTFHPETVSINRNEGYIKELLEAFNELKDFQLLITMPNIDTSSCYIREAIINFAAESDRVFVKESLGTIGYLSAMKYCICMVGNSSSGFVEASFFPTKVVNIGDRQSGRIITSNIFSCPIIKDDIINTVKGAIATDLPAYEMIYGDGTTADKIINHIKNYLNRKDV